MKLPNGEHAQIDEAKLRDYCLDPAHPRGRHKARVFASVFGITQGHVDVLTEALARAAREEDAVPLQSDAWGQRYRIRFRLETAEGNGFVQSAWIVKAGETAPILVTCYVD
jgi:hypothetical protein